MSISSTSKLKVCIAKGLFLTGVLFLLLISIISSGIFFPKISKKSRDLVLVVICSFNSMEFKWQTTKTKHIKILYIIYFLLCYRVPASDLSIAVIYLDRTEVADLIGLFLSYDSTIIILIRFSRRSNLS